MTQCELVLSEDEAFFVAFVETALKAKRGGFKRWGARAIFEVIRYETALSDSDPVFKIRTNKTREFAERAMLENAELEGFFELRG